MRNNIASFEKTSSNQLIFWAKVNAKINFALIFSIILTLLRLVFSKEAILFLIYLLADKATLKFCLWIPVCASRKFEEIFTQESPVRPTT